MTITRIKPKPPVMTLRPPEPAAPATPSTPPPASASDRKPAKLITPASATDKNPAELITPAMAAERLSVTAKVLERWRGAGNGPAFVKLTSKTIRYRPEDLDAFIAGRQRASTATA